MLEYLEKLVAFHSYSSDQKAVHNLLKYVEKHFKKRGYKTKISITNGIYNFYASPTKNTHSKILLASHVDVVPDGPKFAIKDDCCTGRGVYDMLFSVASYMQLVDELHKEKRKCDIAFMLTGDEELDGRSGVDSMLESGYTTDVCILPDAGDDWGSLSVAAKGIYQPTIAIHGQSHHGSRPWEGDGAAIKLAHFLVEIEALFDTSDQYNSTMTVAKITAGKVHNQAPSDAETSLDIRYRDQIDLEYIIKSMDEILKKYNGEIISQVTGVDYVLDPDIPLIQQFVKMYEKHIGRPVRHTKAHGSSDARYFCERNMSVIMLRPDGGNAHGDTEWVSISSLNNFYNLLKEYVITTSQV